MLSNTLKSKRLTLLTVITVFTAFYSHAAPATQTLPEFTANYGVTKYGIKLAEANYQLSYTDTGYKFTQKTRLHGFASMFRNDSVDAVSYVDIVGDELLLREHRYTQTGKEKNRDEAFNIQWDTNAKPAKGIISGVVRSENIKLKTDTAIWEVLSFQIPLMIDANKNKKEYFYNALLKGEIDTYNFSLTSNKTVTFADKEYQTLHMVRIDPKKDRQLHIWLAPELNNLPVIVENYRDGKEHSRMQLESVQFSTEKPLIDKLADNEDDF